MNLDSHCGFFGEVESSFQTPLALESLWIGIPLAPIPLASNTVRSLSWSMECRCLDSKLWEAEA